MADAIPVTKEPSEEVAAKAEKPRKDARRPVLAPEVADSGKPKNSYKMPDGTLVEDY